MSTDNISSHVVAASVVGIVLSTLAIALRLWSRRIVNNALFWWDDHLAVLGWIFGLGDCALSVYWTHIGLGRHNAESYHDGYSKPRMVLPLFVQHFIYNSGITMIKLSLICFYARVFRDQPRLRVGLWVVAALSVAWYIAATVVATCACSPVEKQWNVLMHGSCPGNHGPYLGLAITNNIIDLFILLLPIPVVWKLQMSKLRRLEVTLLFVMGYCFTIFSVVHITEVARFETAQAKHRDFSWNWTLPQALVAVEIPLAVFGICLPCIVLLARRCFKLGWRSMLSTGGATAYRPGLSSSPHIPIEERKGGRDDSHGSITHFLNALGRCSGAVTSTNVQGDPNEELQLVGREEIQVRVDIDVDFDSLPSKTASANTIV